MAGKKMNRRRLEIVHPDCAGIDVGKRHHYVAVDPARCDEPVQKFDAFTDDLERLVEWLRACEVRVVAMEATGVYWVPLYEVLDRAGFEVHLVNPRATKQVSGRKSDVLDCQWIWQLMSYGLLKGAFRPADAICSLRSYVRQRDRLSKDAGRCVQHIEQALAQMNLQLDSVLSDIMGKTGQAILRAIVAGERNGAKLANYRDGRVRADAQTIARALQGNWRDEHLFALEQALARHDFIQRQIADLEARIMTTLESLPKLAPDQSLAKPARRPQQRALQLALQQVLGVDLTAIPTIGVETALVIASEIGPDLSRFPSRQHFCSWLTLAPGTRISGDRALPGRFPKRVNRAGQALRLAASTARSSQSFIGGAHRARLTRLDKGRANKATAHQLARLIYAMLTRGEAYVERTMEDFEAARHDRQVRNLKRRAHQLGMIVTPIEEAA